MFDVLLAQIPDPTQVIKTATELDWTAGMVALMMVSCMAALVYMMKRQNENIIDERRLAAERENRIAARVTHLEDQIRALEKDNSAALLSLTKEMTTALSGFSVIQTQMKNVLQDMVEANNILNGDLKRLCALLEMSPCLALGQMRGSYKIIDDKGNEVRSIVATPQKE